MSDESDVDTSDYEFDDGMPCAMDVVDDARVKVRHSSRSIGGRRVLICAPIGST